MSKTYYLIRYLFGLGGAGFNDALRLFVPHAQGEREKNDGDSPAGAGSYNLSGAELSGTRLSGAGFIEH